LRLAACECGPTADSGVRDCRGWFPLQSGAEPRPEQAC